MFLNANLLASSIGNQNVNVRIENAINKLSVPDYDFLFLLSEI